VFGNEVGERVGRVMTAWRAACRRAKITDLHFHDLRREFASRLLESGASDYSPLLVPRSPRGLEFLRQSLSAKIQRHADTNADAWPTRSILEADHRR